MKNSFFQDNAGDYSSSRLIGFMIVFVALTYCGVVLYLGKDEVVNAAVASGTLFITIAGPAMAFLFAQKRNEIKQDHAQKH